MSDPSAIRELKRIDAARARRAAAVADHPDMTEEQLRSAAVPGGAVRKAVQPGTFRTTTRED